MKEDGHILNQVFITILQREEVEHENSRHVVQCGSTIVMDLDDARVSYVIRKGLQDKARLKRTLQFLDTCRHSLASTYLGKQDEPFAELHISGG